jgi:hypothetical protein
VAVTVVPFAVPSTRTVSPAVTALTEVELVPFRYVTADASFDRHLLTLRVPETPSALLEAG